MLRKLTGAALLTGGLLMTFTGPAQAADNNFTGPHPAGPSISTIERTVEEKPPAALTSVTCTTATVDPQPTWGVRFVGTIGGHTIDVQAHHVPGTHNSEADISAYTTGRGPIHYTITPVWTIPPNPYGVGSGDGTTVTGTLVCHKAPKPTTTTTSTTVVKLLPPVSQRGARGVPVTPTTAAPPMLPHTGTDTAPLAAVGVSLVTVGAFLTRRARLIEWGQRS